MDHSGLPKLYIYIFKIIVNSYNTNFLNNTYYKASAEKVMMRMTLNNTHLRYFIIASSMMDSKSSECMRVSSLFDWILWHTR